MGSALNVMMVKLVKQLDLYLMMINLLGHLRDTLIKKQQRKKYLKMFLRKVISGFLLVTC